jgi:hypothetical protein
MASPYNVSMILVVVLFHTHVVWGKKQDDHFGGVPFGSHRKPNAAAALSAMPQDVSKAVGFHRFDSDWPSGGKLAARYDPCQTGACKCRETLRIDLALTRDTRLVLRWWHLLLGWRTMLCRGLL